MRCAASSVALRSLSSFECTDSWRDEEVEGKRVGGGRLFDLESAITEHQDLNSGSIGLL
jgi:hypothetical protein